MSSINQLISELAHLLKQPNSVPVRRAMKLGIIHARNQAIRQSYDNHNYTDKGLQQRYRTTLIDVPDGDLYGSSGYGLDTIKRTEQKVPRPTRLANNLPFHSVRTFGMKNPYEIAFVREASAKYYKSLTGFCPLLTYDYINDYIYVNVGDDDNFADLKTIIIESVFEYPHLIETETNENKVDLESIDDDDEWFMPEDMVYQVKEFILKFWNPTLQKVATDTNEAPSLTKII